LTSPLALVGLGLVAFGCTGCAAALVSGGGQG
jgi:hypothetical protein